MASDPRILDFWCLSTDYTRGIHGLLGGDGGALWRGGNQVAPRVLPAAGAKNLAMLTVNHYIYALKFVLAR